MTVETLAIVVVGAVTLALVGATLRSARRQALAERARAQELEALAERARADLRAIQRRPKRPHRPPELPYATDAEWEFPWAEGAPLGEGTPAEAGFWVEGVSDPELGTIVAFAGDDGELLGTAVWPEEEK